MEGDLKVGTCSDDRLVMFNGHGFNGHGQTGVMHRWGCLTEWESLPNRDVCLLSDSVQISKQWGII